ncbi:hypothetical protein HPQ64_03905 [Rhizobiales bacterium]|uniref:LPS assembly lipoprotein LptE n=1 Tax=Hongsoonwoonella zoysiae TaxID=2821844 RepID=UPI0015603458|nr:LPS assembly lipoprotein LptE [Hongsoonwoonella zoysiae]NRG16832.1 hypothetical protein [Hongsoonwoonella zoysiae]
MSSSKRDRLFDPSRRRSVSLILGAAGLVLAGCQVKPLYGTWSLGPDSPVAGELAAIEIEQVDSTSADDLKRIGQVLRNEMLFGFRRGGRGEPPRYRLRVILDRQRNEVGVERLADVPASYSVTLNASFVLSEFETDKTLMTGRAFATASYDFSSQRFANLRAERDADNRAAKVIAGDIQTRLAGYFTAQGQG